MVLDFVDSTPKPQTKKSRNKQVGQHQLKIFCTPKESFHKIRKQPMGWVKIFGNHASEKRLISKIHKELLRPNTKNPVHLKNGQSLLIVIFPTKTYKWPIGT